MASMLDSIQNVTKLCTIDNKLFEGAYEYFTVPNIYNIGRTTPLCVVRDLLEPLDHVNAGTMCLFFMISGYNFAVFFNTVGAVPVVVRTRSVGQRQHRPHRVALPAPTVGPEPHVLMLDGPLCINLTNRLWPSRDCANTETARTPWTDWSYEALHGQMFDGQMFDGQVFDGQVFQPPAACMNTNIGEMFQK